MASLYGLRTAHPMAGKTVRLRLAPPAFRTGVLYRAVRGQMPGNGWRFLVHDWFQNVKGCSWREAGEGSPSAAGYCARFLVSSGLPPDDQVVFGILLPPDENWQPTVFLVHQTELGEVLDDPA